MRRSGNRILLLTASTVLITIAAHSQTLQDAVKLTNNEEFEKANAEFKILQQAQPLAGDIYFYCGENFYDWGKMDSAQNSYQKGINANALEPLNYIGLGKVQMINGDSKSAMDNFYKAKTLSKGKNPLVLSKIAEAYISVADKNPNTSSDLLNQAVDLLKQSITLDPKNPTYHIDLGDAYLALTPTNGSNSVEEYNNALSLDPNNLEALLRLGRLWKNARDFKTSYDYFTKATKLDSTFAPAYREQAEMLYELGRYDEAIAAQKKYLQLNNSLTARTRYGEFLFSANKYDDAIGVLKGVLAQDSSNPILYRLLGWSEYEKNDFKNGLVNMNKFFAKSKGTNIKILSNDYLYLGRLLAQNGQDSLAIIALNKAASMINNQSSPDVVNIYQIIAKTYYKDSNYAMAVVYFKKKINADKEAANVNDYYFLGLAQYNNKQYGAADSSFSEITQSNPNLPIGYLLRSRANAQLDSTQTLSKPYYEEYIQKVGDDTLKNKEGLIEAYSQLGYYYFLKQDKANTSLYFKKILSLDPDNANAKAYFESLKFKNIPKGEGKK